MFLTALLILPILLIPSDAFAWGPLTHVYLGSEVMCLGSMLPAAVFELIRKYRQDFIYGNFMADTILAKKCVAFECNSHSWPVALDLLESAATEHERAFCLGYMSHLAADTVAHNRYTAGSRNLGHALMEMRADSVIDASYWLEAIAINRKVQRRNDAFLEKSLKRVIFSFKTNRRIFKGVVALSGLNRGSFAGLSLILPGQRGRLEELHVKSIERMMDVLERGRDSRVLGKCPIGPGGPLDISGPGGLLNALLG
jgi:hypothetical protein